MIKTYKEDLTLAAPLYSETDELWPLSPSDPNWYYAGSEPFEWVSGKGVGETGTDDLIFRPLHSACTPIDCTCTCLLENSTVEQNNYFVSGMYFDFYGLVFNFQTKHEIDNNVFSRVILSNNGLSSVVSEWIEISSGSVVFSIFDDVMHYRAFINGSNVASIAKTEDNYTRQDERENTSRAFLFSCQNTAEDLKFYLSSIDFEYDEFVSNPFWTDLINCHETT